MNRLIKKSILNWSITQKFKIYHVQFTLRALKFLDYMFFFVFLYEITPRYVNLKILPEIVWCFNREIYPPVWELLVYMIDRSSFCIHWWQNKMIPFLFLQSFPIVSCLNIGLNYFIIKNNICHVSCFHFITFYKYLTFA